MGLLITPCPSPIPSVWDPSTADELGSGVKHGQLKELLVQFNGLSGEEQEQFVREVAHVSSKNVLLAASEEIAPLLRRDPFKAMPLEICLKILSHIKDPQSLLAAAQVSHRWYRILSDDSTWRQLCHDHHYKRRSSAASYIHHWSTPKCETAITKNCFPAKCGDVHYDESLLGIQNNLLVLCTETSLPVVRYGTRAQSFEQISPSNSPHVMEATFQDPISQAYFFPRAFEYTEPDSYFSHFKQQFLIHQAWAQSGTLAARYALNTLPNTSVTTVVFGGEYIAVALDSSVILVFHVNGMLLRSLYGHVMGVWCLSINGHTLISGGCDRDVREWDLRTGECLKILRGHQATIRCLAMPDENTAVSGARDAVIQVWDLKEGKSSHRLVGHTAPVRRIECVENELGRLIVSASYDGTAKIWDRDSGALLHSLEGHAAQIYSLACTPSFVFTGSLDSTIQVWDIRTGERRGVLIGHTSLIGQLSICGNILASGSSDGTVRLWDIETLECIHRIAAHDNSVSSLVLTEDRVISAGSDCVVNVWDIRTSELIRTFQKPSLTAQWGIEATEDRLFTAYSDESTIFIELMSFLPGTH